MKIAGIIAEYNPFHNGHARHIQKTCELTKADHIICVISGNFVQRGEPAVTDKWVRTQMALACGADVVIELPFLYATQSAEGFASGGVRLLDALGCVDTLSFGSECGDIDMLLPCARLLAEEPGSLSESIQANVRKGLSYPDARAKALKIISEDMPVNSPNDILAVEYLKALLRSQSNMEPVTVQRKGGGYADRELHGNYSSASAIRAEFERNGVTEKLLKNVPPACAPFYSFDPLTNMENYFRLLLFRLRGMGVQEVSKICDVSEGLEHKIMQGAKNAQTLEALILQVKSKRYTYTRIKRILLYCLFGITKEVTAKANAESPPYARLLGFRKEKESVLSHISRHSRIPLIAKAADFIDHSMLRFDIYATDVYSLLHEKIAPGGRDYTQKLIVV